MPNRKKVAIIMGSDSDWPVVKSACGVLKDFDVPFEAHILSAHRTPEAAAAFAKVQKAPSTAARQHQRRCQHKARRRRVDVLSGRHEPARRLRDKPSDLALATHGLARNRLDGRRRNAPLRRIRSSHRTSHERPGPTGPDETRATSVYRGVG